jgi:two-component system response regulator DegU
MKLLIVDDHAVMRRTVRELVATADDDVREAGDGAEAELAFEAQRPDCVIMDVKMSPVGGIAATRHILGRHPGARIIILTQFDDQDLRDSAREAGASGFVTKDHLDALGELVRPAMA